MEDEEKPEKSPRKPRKPVEMEPEDHGATFAEFDSRIRKLEGTPAAPKSDAWQWWAVPAAVLVVVVVTLVRKRQAEAGHE